MDVISLSKTEVLSQISREAAKSRKKTQKNFKNQFGAKRQNEGEMCQIQQKGTKKTKRLEKNFNREWTRMDAKKTGFFLITESTEDRGWFVWPLTFDL